ncbi:MAG: hypothetical protein QME77_08865, partial [bacterium]|nr:hypothetical protein [bacterium]
RVENQGRPDPQRNPRDGSLGAMSPVEPTSVEPALKWLDGAVVAIGATTAADGKDLLIRLVLNLLDEDSR